MGKVKYPRSLTWDCRHFSVREANRQFLVLTDHGIQCFIVEFDFDTTVSKLWSHEIVGIDAEVGIKKDLAGQKRIWPLDMQVDDHGLGLEATNDNLNTKLKPLQQVSQYHFCHCLSQAHALYPVNERFHGL